jgi:hypothetical protein
MRTMVDIVAADSNDDLTSPYNYTPSAGIAITFLVLFLLSTGKIQTP